MLEPEHRLSLVMEAHLGRQVEVWACRGEGRGCRRNGFRVNKVHCDDCLGPLPKGLTLEQVRNQIRYRETLGNA